MVMVEALACGTPIVATPCGSASEIVRDGITGFVRSDVDSLATAIGYALNQQRALERFLDDGRLPLSNNIIP